MGSIKRCLSAIDRYFLLNHPSLWMVRSHQVFAAVIAMSALAFSASLVMPFYTDAVPDVDAHFLVLLAATVAGTLYWARSVWRRSRGIPLFQAQRRGFLMALCFFHGALLFAPSLLFCRLVDAKIASMVDDRTLRSDIRAMTAADSAIVHYRLVALVRQVAQDGNDEIEAELQKAWRPQLTEAQALRDELTILEVSDGELRDQVARYTRLKELRTKITEHEQSYRLELERATMPSADEFRKLEQKYCGAKSAASARDYLTAASLDVLSYLSPLVTVERPEGPFGSTSARIEYSVFAFPSIRPAFLRECVPTVSDNIIRLVRAKDPPAPAFSHVSLHATTVVMPAIALGAFYVGLILYLLLYLGPKAVIGSLIWVAAFFGAMVLSYAFGGAAGLLRARYGVELPFPVFTPAALALYVPAALLGSSIGWAERVLFRATLGISTFLVCVPMVPFFVLWEEGGRQMFQGDVRDQLSWVPVSIGIALASVSVLVLHRWLVEARSLPR